MFSVVRLRKKNSIANKMYKGLDFQLTHAGLHITGLQIREKDLYSSL